MTAPVAAPGLRRLAHTVLMPGFGGTGEPPAWLRAALAEGLGSVCYFGHNITGPQATAALSARLHATGSVLIALDEEGGTVTRLHAAAGSPHAGAATLGRADDPELTRAVARSLAHEVRAHGADLLLGPVADVNADPANPVIGVRSYGADPALVGRHVAAFTEAVQGEGIAACAKHFPGHGDTKVDTHAGLAVVDVSPETLRARELVPFAAAVRAGARCVMTAHIVFPALDEAPATLSPAVLGLLREELGFTGVIVSDAIDMRAISRTYGFAEGVVRTLAAGVDLVCLGNPALPAAPGEAAGDGEAEFRAALDAILAAVEEGRLPLARLAEAAARVEALARWSAAHRADPVDPGTVAAGREASAVAGERALAVRGPVAGSLTGPVRIVDVRRRRNIASGRLREQVAEALAQRLPGSISTAAFAPQAGVEGRVTDEGAAPSPARTTEADVLLVGTPHADPEQAEALDALLDRNPDALVVCLGWPAGPEDLPRARRAVFTYGDAHPNAEALADLLTGPRRA